MTIWCLSVQCEGAPTGFAYYHYTSRREAERQLADLRRESREVEEAYAKWEREDGAYADRPSDYPFSISTARIEKLEFTGTPRQMVLRALRMHT